MDQVCSEHNLLRVVAHQCPSWRIFKSSFLDRETTIIDETNDGHMAHHIETMETNVVHSLRDLDLSFSLE